MGWFAIILFSVLFFVFDIAINYGDYKYGNGSHFLIKNVKKK